MKKNLTGRHSRCTDLETIEVLRRMSGRFPDDQIAATLNRLGLKTGTGNTWNEGRVRSVRSYHELPACNAAPAPRQTVTLEQASERLGISHKVIRRLIESNKYRPLKSFLGHPGRFRSRQSSLRRLCRKSPARSGDHGTWRSLADHPCRCLLKWGKMLGIEVRTEQSVGLKPTYECLLISAM